MLTRKEMVAIKVCRECYTAATSIANDYALSRKPVPMPALTNFLRKDMALHVAGANFYEAGGMVKIDLAQSLRTGRVVVIE